MSPALVSWENTVVVGVAALAAYLIGRWHGADDRNDLAWRLKISTKVLEDARDIWRNDPFRVAMDADRVLRVIEHNDFAVEDQDAN